MLLLLAACSGECNGGPVKLGGSITVTVTDSPLTYPVKPLTYPTVDWGGLTESSACGAFDPMGQESAFLEYVPERSCDEVVADMVAGTFLQSDIGSYSAVDVAGRTSVLFDDTTFAASTGWPDAFVEDASACWLFTLSDGTTVTVDAVVVPTDDESSSTATLVDACSFAAIANFAAAAPAAPSKDSRGDCTDEWTFDWIDATDSSDAPLGMVDTLTLYRFEDGVGDSLDLTSLADEADGWWSEAVTGTSADTSDLAPGKGGGFPGLDADGDWLLTLSSSTSLDRYPPFLALVSG